MLDLENFVNENKIPNYGKYETLSLVSLLKKDYRKLLYINL